MSYLSDVHEITGREAMQRTWERARAEGSPEKIEAARKAGKFIVTYQVPVFSDCDALVGHVPFFDGAYNSEEEAQASLDDDVEFDVFDSYQVMESPEVLTFDEAKAKLKANGGGILARCGKGFTAIIG